jgi:hypothetical protein
MIELLVISAIVGKQEIAPNVMMIDYLTSDNQIVTVLENVSNEEKGKMQVAVQSN